MARGNMVPWNAWLVFHDADEEASYSRAAQQGWRCTGTMTARIFIVLGVVETVRGLSNSVHPLFYFYIFLWSVVMPGFYLSLASRYPGTYRAIQTQLHVAYRVFIAISFASSVFLQRMWEKTTPIAVFMNIMSHSPAFANFFVGMGYRVQFRHHLATQALATVLSWPWIHSLCTACANDAEIRESVHTIGSITERSLVPLSTLLPDSGFGAQQKYGCWLVGGFLHLVLSFVATSFIVYAAECVGRAGHLAQREGGKMRGVGRDSVLFASALLLVFIQVSWFVIKAADRLGEAQCATLD